MAVILPSVYKDGTATVAANGTVVTGQSTLWVNSVLPGDFFGVHKGWNIEIASVDSNTQLTLSNPYPGDAQTAAPYAIQLQSDNARMQETSRQLLETLSSGNNYAFSQLVGATDTIPYFTGPGTMGLLTREELTTGVNYDVLVNTLADRATYDTSPTGFTVLVADIGDGRSAVYSKRSATTGDWSAPAYITGASGATGATPTVTASATQLAAGATPTAVASAITGGVNIAFGIPGALTSGFPYRWSTTVTDANPGNGFIRANNAALGSATLLFVSKTSLAGSAMATFLLAMGAVDNAIKGTLILQRVTDGQTVSFNVTGVTDATNYVKVAVSGQSGLTAIANNVDLNFLFTQAGNKGTDGAGAGTVTSVALTLPTGFSVSGSPITTSGTFVLSYSAGYKGYTTVEANKLAGIATGAQVNSVTSVAGRTGAVVIDSGDISGLGGAATLNVGTGSGTVAAGNDTRFNDNAKLSVEDQALTGGARVTSKDLGTMTTGTLTLDPGDRPLQHYINNGAHTLSPGTNTGSFMLDITNGASAGAITVTGWTKVAGDVFTTTSGNKFRLHCSVGNGGSLLIVQALQ